VITLARRRLLIGAAGIVLAGRAPAHATETEVAALIRALTGGAPLLPGGVVLDLPTLVENGNAVAMTVGVDGSPAGPDRVRAIHVFAERNPLPRVASFSFGPRSGRPRVATRIRLATSQTVIAVAVLEDGRCRTDSVELLVTLAACTE